PPSQGKPSQTPPSQMKPTSSSGSQTSGTSTKGQKHHQSVSHDKKTKGEASTPTSVNPDKKQNTGKPANQPKAGGKSGLPPANGERQMKIPHK
ncbi:MAG: hypothetical protein IJS15_04165, partial [Victivallales bacterium]|nr:hypothetical protein [Victivallales bacterium]